MSQPPANLEYAPEHMEAGVTVRGDGANVSISIRANRDRVVRACLAPAIYATGALYMFFKLYWLPRRAGSGDFINLLLPVVFMLLALYQAFVSIFFLNFPITLELDESQLLLRWRTFKSMHSLAWNRSVIRGVGLERLKSKNQLIKRPYLILHILGQGNVGILSTTRKQVEFVAKVLREALGLPHEGHPALSIPRPPKCRYRCIPWAGGVRLNIPPRISPWMYALFAIISVGISVTVLAAVRHFGIAEENMLPWIGMVGFSLLLGVAIFALLHKSFKSARKATAFFSSAYLFHAVQSGFFHPLDHRWDAKEIRDVRVVEEAGSPPALQIVPFAGLPLKLLEGERIEDIQWSAAVLKKCLPDVEVQKTQIPAGKSLNDPAKDTLE